MASYGQWAKSFASHGASRVTWVCGAERVLVAEVSAAVSAAVAPAESESWTAGRARERDIWASALAVPFTTPRLVLVQDAGRLRDWWKLRAWLDDRQVLRASYLVFCAREEDFPRVDGKLAEPCTWLRDSSVAQVIRCAPLAPDDAATWACRQLPGLSPVQARQLLNRSSGSLAEVRGVLAKARALGGAVNDAALALLCEELPGDFADLVIGGDRAAAMLAAETLGSTGLGWSLGVLASRLPVLATLHRAARDNVSRRDVVGRLGVPAFLAQRYAGVARDYGEARVARCWAALAVAEDAYRGGASTGVAEALAASW